MRSVMKHDFSKAPMANINRSSFDRSRAYKTAFSVGQLIPIYVDEVLPGDTVSLAPKAVCRMATPIYPLMDNLFVETFWFFVPMRQIWDNARKFFGEQANPADSIDYTIPRIADNAAVFTENTLADYFGLPTQVANIRTEQPINALPFRAYNHIWNEWFRNQNVQDSVPVPTGDGPDTLGGNYALLKRNKRPDYYTSVLPWPQKGDSVDLPLGTEAPVFGDAIGDGRLDILSQDGLGGSLRYHSQGTTNVEYNASGSQGHQLKADLSNATAATINELRQAFQIQKLLERDARGGTRYAEVVKAHFNVDFLDVTYRPVYLGSTHAPVSINQVEQTSETNVANTPQGNLAAWAVAVNKRGGFTQSFTEHGYIIGLANVRADLTYQQGLDRIWSRRTRLDFYWPALAHIGEQPVYSKEIYCDATAGDETVLGYQERNAEYRYGRSKITGPFRSNYPGGSLDPWHLSEEFASRPVLDNTFVTDQTPMTRVKAVDTEPDFICDFYFQERWVRPMPMYGVPGLIDHF